MNRKLRITFRNGDVRLGDFPAGQTLPQLWGTFKRDGAIIGDVWCAHLDFVAMIEVAEIARGAASELDTESRPLADQNVARLAVGMGIGAFKPPGEA